MNFGVPREVRPLEYRAGLTPVSVHALVGAGHQVFVERGAGLSAGFRDRDYQAVGGNIVYSAAEAYGRADVVVKVTRPTEAEYERFRTGQVLMAFLHAAVASPDLLQALREREITAVGYETVQADDGTLPVLLPTSEVAGRMAPIIAGQLLESVDGGRGILLSGIPGVPPDAWRPAGQPTTSIHPTLRSWTLDNPVANRRDRRGESSLSPGCSECCRC